MPGSITVDNKIVTRDVAKAPAITSLMAEYNAVAAPIANVVVGATTAPLTRANINATTGDSQLGRLIADAQLAHPSVSGAQIAFMNPGGIRSDLAAGPITHGRGVRRPAVQQRHDGPHLHRRGDRDDPRAAVRAHRRDRGAARVILQVSAGFTYEYSLSAAGREQGRPRIDQAQRDDHRPDRDLHTWP